MYESSNGGNPGWRRGTQFCSETAAPKSGAARGSTSVARASVSRLPGPMPGPGWDGGSLSSSSAPSATYGARARSTWLVGRASIQQVVRDTATRGNSPRATSPDGDEDVSLTMGGLGVRVA